MPIIRYITISTRRRRRTLYARLAKALLEKGDTTRATEVLDTGIRKIRSARIRHNYMSTVPDHRGLLYGRSFRQGKRGAGRICENLEENITYYLRFTGKYKDLTLRDVKENAEYLYDLYQIAGMFGQTGQARQIEPVPHRQRNRGR